MATSRHGTNQVTDSRSPAGPQSANNRWTGLKTFGLGIVTGAADDDPSAIGTYASAGAKLGPAFLWIAPAMFPMMITVVYLSSKLGQVSGKGLFDVLRDHYPKWLMYAVLTGVLIGNTIEAGADIAGMSAALGVIINVPHTVIVVLTTSSIFALQLWGSYTFIRDTFRWLSLALLAYVGSALMVKPDLIPVIKGTFVPTLHFSRDYLSMIVAVMGASLSAYIYTWQSNQEVEEKIAAGRHRLWQRQGTTHRDLKHSAREVVFGMLFSSLIMYFIMLSTASTLFKNKQFNISTAAQAAQALRPLAGNAAGLLFALGIVGVGFLAVPVMTTGAAYDLCQTVGWKHGLYKKPSEARKFYAAIGGFTSIAMGMNFLGINPMKALIFAGIVQGFSTPFLMVLIMLLTRNSKIMGKWANTRKMNVAGWCTTAAISAASAGLIVSWLW
jgi:NRAMP (natural resistance-associated macrophage protein)-like metal ion transporter